jgi:hypothetical protein
MERKMDYGKQCDFIFFSINKKDIDENTLDFSNSKARFITKSPRDKTDQIIKTRLQFLNQRFSGWHELKYLKYKTAAIISTLTTAVLI